MNLSCHYLDGYRKLVFYYNFLKLSQTSISFDLLKLVECIIELQEILFVEIKLRLITDILMIRITMHFLIGFLENRGSLLTRSF